MGPEGDYSEHLEGLGLADGYRKKAVAALALAGACLAAGCSSGPDLPAELSPNVASTLIAQTWGHDQQNHFTVTFHSDTLIACGIQNDLWKHVETVHDGLPISTYELTAAGKKALYAIDLKESGKYHEVILQGPYLVEAKSMAPGSQPDQRQVTIHWELDWDKAAAGVKACFPRFELSGTQVGVFQVAGQDWRFLGFLKPPEAAPGPQARLRSEGRRG